MLGISFSQKNNFSNFIYTVLEFLDFVVIVELSFLQAVFHVGRNTFSHRTPAVLI